MGAQTATTEGSTGKAKIMSVLLRSLFYSGPPFTRICLDRPIFGQTRPRGASKSTGSSCSVGCTTNQPRRPVLEPLHSFWARNPSTIGSWCSTEPRSVVSHVELRTTTSTSSVTSTTSSASSTTGTAGRKAAGQVVLVFNVSRFGIRTLMF